MEEMWTMTVGDVVDLCDRDCYSVWNGPPKVSTVDHWLCVQGREVATVRFRRVGAKKKHVMEEWVVVTERMGKQNMSRVWTVETPWEGWFTSEFLGD